MDVSHILDNLNDDQRNAVTSEKQHLLVLAGAGSGKTRVLVHKVAWEVEALGKNPSSIMAVTFTNKDANEMQAMGVDMESEINKLKRNIKLQFAADNAESLKVMIANEDKQFSEYEQTEIFQIPNSSL